MGSPINTYNSPPPEGWNNPLGYPAPYPGPNYGSPTPPKSNRGVVAAVIIAAVILLSAIGIGGFLLMNKNKDGSGGDNNDQSQTTAVNFSKNSAYTATVPKDWEKIAPPTDRDYIENLAKIGKHGETAYTITLGEFTDPDPESYLDTYRSASDADIEDITVDGEPGIKVQYETLLTYYIAAKDRIIQIETDWPIGDDTGKKDVFKAADEVVKSIRFKNNS